MKKVLFIDRDGTILVEPPIDYQIDSLDKFQFVSGAISGLKTLSKLGYELVMASNQDGLGTESFPMEDFLPLQELMLSVLKSEGIVFDDILIDPTFPEDNAPTRKPGIGMFGKYLSGEYDLASSYVIGDRDSDAMLAKNLGTRFLRIGELSWSEIANLLSLESRSATVVRNTRETQVSVSLTLDDSSPSSIDTGLKFFDHMLEQIATHGNIRLDISAKGDLEVDEHHTMEDVAITLGTALLQALGNKRGIARYGFALPMDESEAFVLLDFGGRIDFEWDVPFTREYVGDTPTEMFRHVFQSLASAMQCNLHIRAKGENNHHLAEAVFKAFARALKAAVHRQPFDDKLPTSKGYL
ncbi:MAG: bifunctional histidinol-phosphatase/imidazoleglycerol-phosphate dehydratase HisB [Bacteroidaceae bacterium]|nr:bifunctional histidinol-phosphatase/imidazoleglycerol-phosphate dehydratase HisB [Bacteroidaceae bacterium]